MRTSERVVPPLAGVCVAALLAVASAAAPDEAASADAGWRVAEPGYAWSFPRDHWSHPDYRTEWWYLTGHLTAVDDPAQRFGYQFTVFRVGLTPAAPPLDSAWSVGDLAMGHAAISDLTAREHVFSEAIRRATPWLAGFEPYPGEAAAAGATVAWLRAPAGTDARWTVAWNGRGFDVAMRDDRLGLAFELTTVAEKPLVLHGDRGYSAKAAAGEAASLYYSFTRLATQGTVTRAGRTWRVQGRSWMDKEFSTSTLGARQVGWDWFSLQLDDGRDLMLYVLRRPDGSIDWGSGTLVDPSGAARTLPRDAFEVRVRERWAGAGGGPGYPVAWTVELPGEDLRLRIRAAFPAQENRSDLLDGLDYWEGAVTVRDEAGRELGRGYVEMTGYGEGSRPPV